MVSPPGYYTTPGVFRQEKSALWALQEQKEITLDCLFFQTFQSRVISVQSWYLTSLINLSFLRSTSLCMLHLQTYSIHNSHQREVLIRGRLIMEANVVFAGSRFSVSQGGWGWTVAFLIHVKKACIPELKSRWLFGRRRPYLAAAAIFRVCE